MRACGVMLDDSSECGYSCHELHATLTTGSYFNDLIGFSAGLLIAILLAVLTLRAARLPSAPVSNIAFAICALLWSAGGLAHAALLSAGLDRSSTWVLVTETTQFSGAAGFPIPILAIWGSAARILKRVASLTAMVTVVLLWTAALNAPHPSMQILKWCTFLNASLFLMLGAMVSLRRRSTPRAVYLPSLVIVGSVCGASVSFVFARHVPMNRVFVSTFGAVGAHLVLLVIIGSFLLFSRFRYADTFIRYSVRIVLAAMWASGIALVAQTPSLLRLAHQTSFPQAIHAVAIVIVANLLLLNFAFVDEQISDLVNRWLFHPPDYRAATRKLAQTLRNAQIDAEVLAALEESVSSTLGVERATAKPAPSAGVIEGEIVEIASAELLVPIASAGRVAYVLHVTPGQSRPGFVMNDLNFLRAVAAQAGLRLDALREAALQQQVAEAELRALRAQINPHFLFNSLNTIADLTVRNPARAETMTLRLASVFRHVLAHSSRPLTSVRDEIEFLRTYLYIEEVRFGDRLQVAIEVAPEVASENIPSLILQPLVENALKHGLGPKPGPGHLWISAQADANQIRLTIEDDGMGLATNGVHGLGLANVASRLKTLYQDRASVIMEPRAAGGTRVTVLLPRERMV